jgi:hypothetical protein
MLHTRIVTVKRYNTEHSELEPVANEQPALKKSCKEKVMQVVEPMLAPIAQVVASHEQQLDIIKDKIEALESIFTAELATEDVKSSAFILKFPTEEDFKKAEPCLRSLSDLLEKQNIDFEILELS